MQDNYQIQAQQAKQVFLTYDRGAIARRLGLSPQGEFFCCRFFGEPCRVSCSTGDIFRYHNGSWIPADSHGEVMTLLDLLCDSSPDRHPAGHYQSMQSFGHQFHRDLNENQKNPAADRFQQDPEALRRACRALGGSPFSPGDVAFSIPVFEDLTVCLQFFEGDEEFAPRLRFLWDANALQYLKYETMYFAVDVLLSRIFELF